MEGTGGELDTFNLTPKSPRSRLDSPHYEKSPIFITSNLNGTLPSKQLFQALKQSDKKANEIDQFFKLEELESKVFQLTNENSALTKGIERLQDMVAKTKDEMEQTIQDLNDAHMEEIGQLQLQIKERDGQVALLNEDIDHMHGSIEYY